ncbi:MAG TPA: carboxypeptidase-like regulatory domain-containing protein [Chitinophagaceae bacterium]|nr:carboxypeptidase-like regulatory domain-containing protein [Chitinophagaceae bacterium]
MLLKQLISAISCFLLLFIPAIDAIAQNTILTGKVTDAEGNPVENVSVVVKGRSIGTTTADNGTYQLQVTKPSGNLLVFSSVNFADKEVTRSQGNTINVQLERSSQSLDAIVVIGYGTQQRKDLTGAVGQLKATRLENETPQSVQDALRGNIAGLNISQINAASAKGDGDLLVRGIRTIHNDQYTINPYPVLSPVPSNAIQANSNGIINQNEGYFGYESNVPPLTTIP